MYIYTLHICYKCQVKFFPDNNPVHVIMCTFHLLFFKIQHIWHIHDLTPAFLVLYLKYKKFQETLWVTVKQYFVPSWAVFCAMLGSYLQYFSQNFTSGPKSPQKNFFGANLFMKGTNKLKDTERKMYYILGSKALEDHFA